MIKAYEKINLWKWFFGMAFDNGLEFYYFRKISFTPLMGDNIFNPGGDHGAFVVEYVENIIGSPWIDSYTCHYNDLLSLLYLTSETITCD